MYNNLGGGRKITIGIIATLALLLIFALGLLLYPRTVLQEENVSHITTSIPVVHQWRSGVHTYVGVIQAPSPCHSVAGGALVKESYPEQVDIRIETRESGEMCAQVITEKKFRVSFSASEEAVARAYLNGTGVLFRVSEASLSEDLLKMSL